MNAAQIMLITACAGRANMVGGGGTDPDDRLYKATLVVLGVLTAAACCVILSLLYKH